MSSQWLYNALIIMSVLFIVGFLLIWNATNIAQSVGINHDGGIETQYYYNLIFYSIENYRTAGFVISSLGGVGMLLSGYTLYKNFSY